MTADKDPFVVRDNLCPRCEGISVNVVAPHCCAICRVDIALEHMLGVEILAAQWPIQGAAEFERFSNRRVR